MNNHDDFRKLDFYDLTASYPVSRRQFLKLSGGGIFVLFTLSDTATAQRRGGRLPDDFNAFLRIGEDGRVNCFSGKIEMGQGIFTSLAQMIADELDVALENVDMVMGDTDLCPWDMGTFGSMTTRFFGPPLREAATAAREVLLTLASEFLHVPKKDLRAENGIIMLRSDRKKRVAYAQLTRGKKIARKLKEKAVLKKPEQFTIVNKPLNRRDALEKVTGKAEYAGDVHFPDMLFAKILRPPAHGAVLHSLDTSAASEVDGIKLVREKDMIAIMHPEMEQAEKALSLIEARYEESDSKTNDKTIFDHMLKMAPGGREVSSGGDLTAGEKSSVKMVEHTYLDGYVAHAPIEPHTAIAKVNGEKATIWASTQTPFGLKSQAARVLGFDEKNVRVITPFVGGGFGGKTNNQQAIEAARLAKATGRPVQVAWTRAEEFFYDSFRPAALVKIKAGVDANGFISLWDFGVYYAGQRGAQHFYNIPHHRTLAFNPSWTAPEGTHPFGTGPWRAPANNTNVFARESHIEMLAARAGIDPLAFRLKNLKDKRMVRVLKAAAKQFGWTEAKGPSGRGFGISLGIDAGTYVAHMAEVAVDKNTGKVRVKRVVCVQDMGLVINPEGARIQMEGCITMGLGYALTEDIHFRNGKILDLNFDTYEIPRFSWLPEIDTVMLDLKEDPPQGGGEPAIIGMGAVIANAIYDATGARLLQMPMTPARVKEALDMEKG